MFVPYFLFLCLIFFFTFFFFFIFCFFFFFSHHLFYLLYNSLIPRYFIFIYLFHLNILFVYFSSLIPLILRPGPTMPSFHFTLIAATTAVLLFAAPLFAYPTTHGPIIPPLYGVLELLQNGRQDEKSSHCKLQLDLPTVDGMRVQNHLY